MFDAGRDQLRSAFVEAWQARRAGRPLTPLQEQIAAAIADHPEYHALLDSPDAIGREFTPEGGETNPFLHLSLHLAVRDQVATDRPPGIAALYRAFASALGDEHAAQHRLLERLAETLWRAQRDGALPDEQAYLAALRDDLRRLGHEPPGGL